LPSSQEKQEEPTTHNSTTSISNNTDVGVSEDLIRLIQAREKRARFRELTQHTDVQLLTMHTFPAPIGLRLAGVVSARTVKLFRSKNRKAEVQQHFDKWWSELRQEIRRHARALRCQFVIGYTEHLTVCDGNSTLLSLFFEISSLSSCSFAIRFSSGQNPSHNNILVVVVVVVVVAYYCYCRYHSSLCIRNGCESQSQTQSRGHSRSKRKQRERQKITNP
jgi:hypothetical protein